MRRFLTIFVTFASLGLLCASFLGFAASAYWFFDLLNHFRVQFLVASGLGLFFALVLQSKPLAWTCVVIALVNAILIAPLFFQRPDQPKSSRELAIVSYNTWIHNGDWASVLLTLQEADPDIVYFTETHPNIQTGVYGLESDFHIFQLKSDMLLVRRSAELSPQLIEIPAGKGIVGIGVRLSVGGAEVALLGVHPPAPLTSTH